MRFCGAAMEVHQQLGHGLLEPVYQQSLAVQVAAWEIPFAREVELPVYYNGRLPSCSYKADLFALSA